MLALLDQDYAPIIANETEAAIARNAAEKLIAVANANQDITLHVEGAVILVCPYLL